MTIHNRLKSDYLDFLHNFQHFYNLKFYFELYLKEPGVTVRVGWAPENRHGKGTPPL